MTTDVGLFVHLLALDLPYFTPSSTGNAWCDVRPSFLFGSLSKTLGHINTRPRLGMTVKSSLSKFVPPPAGTSFKYR